MQQSGSKTNQIQNILIPSILLKTIKSNNIYWIPKIPKIAKITYLALIKFKLNHSL